MNEPVDLLTIFALPPETPIKSATFLVHAGCVERAIKFNDALRALIDGGHLTMHPEDTRLPFNFCYHCRGFPAWKK